MHSADLLDKDVSHGHRDGAESGGRYHTPENYATNKVFISGIFQVIFF